MIESYKYKYNDNAVCPYCDHEDADSWEWDKDGIEEKDVECGNCGKEFHLSIDHSTTYSTSRIEN